MKSAQMHVLRNVKQSLRAAQNNKNLLNQVIQQKPRYRGFCILNGPPSRLREASAKQGAKATAPKPQCLFTFLWMLSTSSMNSATFGSA